MSWKCDKCGEIFYYADEMSFIDEEGNEIIFDESNFINPKKQYCNVCADEINTK